jgi:hypothetical protein
VISGAAERIVGWAPARRPGPNARARERFQAHPLALAGSAVLALLVALAILAPWVTP